MYFSKYSHKLGSKEHMREWSNAIDEKPPNYALQNLLLDNGSIIRGWWTGTAWDGLKYKYGFQVIKFKKCGE